MVVRVTPAIGVNQTHRQRTHLGMVLQVAHRLGQRVRVHPRVGVEEKDVLAPGNGRSHIVGR